VVGTRSDTKWVVIWPNAKKRTDIAIYRVIYCGRKYN
jgi:hypothetical protein